MFSVAETHFSTIKEPFSELGHAGQDDSPSEDKERDEDLLTSIEYVVLMTSLYSL